MKRTHGMQNAELREKKDPHGTVNEVSGRPYATSGEMIEASAGIFVV
jgi:hypothetical protein